MELGMQQLLKPSFIAADTWVVQLNFECLDGGE